jgi:hypothetical protein
MGKIRFAVAVFAVLVSSLAARAQATQVPPTIDYDTYMQQDFEGRIKSFNQIAPENRAELVQTQIRRWVEKNRSRLSPAQLKIMDENLAFVTADLYRQPMSQAHAAQQKDLEKRTAMVFSTEDMRQALTIHAAYIPKNP